MLRPMHEIHLGRDDGVHLLPEEALTALVVAEAGEDDVGCVLVRVGVVPHRAARRGAAVEEAAAVPRLEPEPEEAGRHPS